VRGLTKRPERWAAEDRVISPDGRPAGAAAEQRRGGHAGKRLNLLLTPWGSCSLAGPRQFRASSLFYCSQSQTLAMTRRRRSYMVRSDSRGGHFPEHRLIMASPATVPSPARAFSSRPLLLPPIRPHICADHAALRADHSWPEPAHLDISWLSTLITDVGTRSRSRPATGPRSAACWRGPLARSCT
jgi:hypothetical protein